MNLSEKKLQVIGRQAIEGAQKPTHPERENLQCLAFSELLEARKKRSPVKPFAFAAAAAAIIAAVSFQLLSPSQIPFWIGPSSSPGTEGSWVDSSAEEQMTIRFEGGTRFQLGKSSAARVIETNSDQVAVDLARGNLHCAVNGNGKTRWMVHAGTYSVTVTGTEFSVNWSPSSSILNVHVTEGTVLVSGEELNPNGVILSMGDSLDVQADEITISRKSAAPSSSDPQSKNGLTIAASQSDNSSSGDDENVVDGSESAETLQKDLDGGRSNHRHKVQPSTRANIPEWKICYNKRDFKGAVSAAKSHGLDGLANSLNTDDLWSLSEAARYTRDGAAAHKLLLAMTKRFPASKEARNATFLLGRVSEELLHNPTGAQRWYEQYLSMGPKGPLYEQSLGRLIDVYRQTGGHQKAQNYAKTYLSKFPKGSFAESAHSALE